MDTAQRAERFVDENLLGLVDGLIDGDSPVNRELAATNACEWSCHLGEVLDFDPVADGWTFRASASISGEQLADMPLGPVAGELEVSGVITAAGAGFELEDVSVDEVRLVAE